MNLSNIICETLTLFLIGGHKFKFFYNNGVWSYYKCTRCGEVWDDFHLGIEGYL